MKNIFILFLLFFSANAFAQKSDTLIVPVGKYQFIKVGDKVYRLETTLVEVEKPTKNFWGLIADSLPTITYPIWRGIGIPGTTLTPNDLPSFNHIQLAPSKNNMGTATPAIWNPDSNDNFKLNIKQQ